MQHCGPGSWLGSELTVRAKNDTASIILHLLCQEGASKPGTLLHCHPSFMLFVVVFQRIENNLHILITHLWKMCSRIQNES